MINDKTQHQSSGDKSENYQAGTINQYGISYRDARDIALDIFNSNIEKLNAQAKQVASERAQEITEKFLKDLQNKNEKLLNSLQDPSMQLALYSAQKSYVRSGDKDISDLLVDILVARAEQNDRTLLQIVLDESLEIVPKLTPEQLSALSVVFFLKYSQDRRINSLETLGTYFNKLGAFVVNLTKEDSCYQHLEYCNCGSISFIPSTIESILLQNYKGLFSKGIVLEEFERTYGAISGFPNLITKCLHSDSKIQINAIDQDILEKQSTINGISKENTDKLVACFNSIAMSENEVETYLQTQGDMITKLLDIWNNSAIKNMTLTSVGIALAQANAKRVTGESIDLSIWIK